MKLWEKAMLFGFLWSIQGDVRDEPVLKVVCALFAIAYFATAVYCVLKPNDRLHGGKYARKDGVGYVEKGAKRNESYRARLGSASVAVSILRWGGIGLPWQGTLH